LIDLHSHILPGLDDGVRTVAESVELARLAEASGIEAIAATPHVRHDWPTRPEEMEQRLADVRAAVAAAGLSIEVLPGGELALEELARPLDELRRFGLGGNRNLLLVEMPFNGWPLDLEQRLFQLRTAAIVPLLAHPERNREVQERPERVAPLVDSGTFVQLTAASLDGRGGKRAQAAAHRLIADGLAHVVASDAHAPDVRRGGLDSVADALGNEELARWLTRDVPGALVRGEAVPPRPQRRRKRLGLF
jgi:protein-tyrosine phosphatase